MKNKMNKKGASLSGWTEGAIVITLILIIIGIIVVDMNAKYNQNHDSTFGMNTSLQNWVAYQSTFEEGMKGEASTSAFTGISLGSTWAMIKFGLSTVFQFLTGGFISTAIGLLNWGSVGTALALALRLLFVTSVGYILLKLILKVKP